jgi:hypothetical protein
MVLNLAKCSNYKLTKLTINQIYQKTDVKEIIVKNIDALYISLAAKAKLREWNLLHESNNNIKN